MWRSPAAVWGVVLAGALSAGCLEPFQSPAILDSLRVLSVRAEPPEIRPGEMLAVDALVYTPRARALSWSWSACLLEVPFTRGISSFSGGGGGGAQSGERIPSEQAEPPASCFDMEDAFPMAPGPTSQAAFPPLPPGLLDRELPDVELPPQLAGLFRIPDLVNLAVLAGFYFTVSLRVSDGVETVVANKRVVVKLVPPSGAPRTSMSDDEGAEERGVDVVTYGYDDQQLVVRAHFPDRPPPASAGMVLVIELGGGYVASLPLPPDGDAAATGARASVLADGTVEVSVSLEAAGVGPADPLGFRVSVRDESGEVDAVPNAGLRWVHGGQRNDNPPEPSLARADDPEAGPLTVLSAPTGAEVRLRPQVLPKVPGDEGRQSYPFLTFQGQVELRQEELFFSWFTDAGAVGPQKTHGLHPKDIDTTWTAPPAPPEPGREAALYLVVRDGRGGTSWTSVPVR